MIEYFDTKKTLDENLAWLTQKTEEPKCNEGNFTPPPPPPPHTHTHSKFN